ncbi:DUF2459 domain-containing protein [Roseococcus sp. YIM B11640]|uniref:DUF2459 domain-containing protein n=1 Tax=Roseococcus sp. YIM B11640 TaxID=3133973 RepID=UPI003C7D6767
MVGTAGLAGCTAIPASPACATAGPDAIRVVARSWHTEIAVPASLLPALAPSYPGARVLMLGFGKRNFMLAPARGLSEWLAGPFPGPAVIQVTALTAPPEQAMNADILAIGTGEDSLRRLGTALMASFRADGDGKPVFVSQVERTDFFDAARGYSLDYTCNSWTADMLLAAGMPLRVEDATLASGVLRQVAALPGACRPPRISAPSLAGRS